MPEPTCHEKSDESTSQNWVRDKLHQEKALPTRKCTRPVLACCPRPLTESLVSSPWWWRGPSEPLGAGGNLHPTGNPGERRTGRELPCTDWTASSPGKNNKQTKQQQLTGTNKP